MIKKNRFAILLISFLLITWFTPSIIRDNIASATTTYAFNLITIQPTPGYATWDVTTDGNFTYVADDDGGLIIYNSTSLNYLTSIDNGSNYLGVATYTFGNSVFIAVACYTEGLRMYNFTYTNDSWYNLTLCDTINASEEFQAVCFNSTGAIYAGAGQDGIKAYSFDYGATNTFTWLGGRNDGTPTTGGILDVVTNGVYIYACCRNLGLRVYTFNGATFTLLDTNVDSTAEYLSIYIDKNNYIYTTCGNSVTPPGYKDQLLVYTFFASTLSLRHTITLSTTSSTQTYVAGDDNYIYLDHSLNGITAYTLFNGATMTQLSTKKDGVSGYYRLTSDSNYIYCTVQNLGLYIYTFTATTITSIDVRTLPATNISYTWATLNGMIPNYFGDNVTDYGFQLGRTTTYSYGYLNSSYTSFGYDYITTKNTHYTDQSFDIYYDGTYYYVAVGNNGFEAFTYDTISGFTSIAYKVVGVPIVAIYGDGTYIYAGSSTSWRAYSFNGSVFTFLATIPAVVSAVSTSMWYDGTYLYFENASGLGAWTFNGVTFTRHGYGFYGQYGVKIPNPTSLPPSEGFCVAYSHNDTYMAVGSHSAPRITLYKKGSLNGTYYKIATPATPPTGRVWNIAFSHNDTYMAVAHDTSPYVTIYKLTSGVWVKMANPATLPTGDGFDVAFSHNSSLLAVAHDTSPYVTIYKLTSGVWVKIADPATLPADTGRSVAFSHNSSLLTVGSYTTTGATCLIIYKLGAINNTYYRIPNPPNDPHSWVRSIAFSHDSTYMAFVTGSLRLYKLGAFNNTYYEIATPQATHPTTVEDVTFSNDSTYMATAYQYNPAGPTESSSYFAVFKYNSTDGTYHQLSEPDTPAGSLLGDGHGVAFTHDGNRLAVAHRDSPYVSMYTNNFTEIHYAPLWGDGTYIYTGTSKLCMFIFNGTIFTRCAYWDDTWFAPPYGKYYDVWGDGNYIYTASGTYGISAYFFDGHKLDFRDNINLGGFSNPHSISGDNNFIYVAGWSDLIALTYDGGTFYQIAEDTSFGYYSAMICVDNITFVTGDMGIGAYAFLLRLNITGLTPGTLYHFRAYANNSNGINYGIDRTFTTLMHGSVPVNIGINVFNESNGSQALTFNIVIKNLNGTQAYALLDQHNTLQINTSAFTGNQNVLIKVWADDYRERIMIVPLYNSLIANYTFYLPREIMSAGADPGGGSGYAPGSDIIPVIYTLRVVETIMTDFSEFDRPIKDAWVNIKRYVNSTGQQELMSTLLTDTNGYCNVYLIPSVLYLFNITATGYYQMIADWNPIPPNAYQQNENKIFRLVRIDFIQPTLNFTYLMKNITWSLSPLTTQNQGAIPFVFHITSKDGRLQWYRMTVEYLNVSNHTWVMLYNGNASTATGGYLNYTTPNITGQYRVELYFKKYGYHEYKLFHLGSLHYTIIFLKAWLKAIPDFVFYLVIIVLMIMIMGFCYIKLGTGIITGYIGLFVFAFGLLLKPGLAINGFSGWAIFATTFVLYTMGMFLWSRI